MPGPVQPRFLSTFPLVLPRTRPSRTKVWRAVRVPAYFLIGFVILDLVAYASRSGFERYAPDDYAEKVAGCAARRPDLVVVGGSPVAEGIDPAVLTGLSWHAVPVASPYAIGLPGGTTTDFYHALLRACPKPPRLVVYGATASDWNDARNEPHGAYSLMTLGDVWHCRAVRPDAAGWMMKQYLEGRLARASATFRYRNGIRLWAAVQADRIRAGCSPAAVREANDQAAFSAAIRAGSGYAPMAGFVHRRYDRAKAAGDPGPPFGFLDKYRTGSHLKYLDELLSWAETRGVNVVLVDMPVTADLERMYPAAFSEYRTRLAEVEARGVTVIRASRDAVGLGEDKFADMIHLNAEGAATLSAWLRGQLAAAGGRP